MAREPSRAARVRGQGAAPRSRSQRQRPAPKSQAGHKSERSGFRQFVRECWAELQRVQWPNRQELFQASAVVLIVCFIIGVYIAGLDALFTRFSSWLIDQYTRH